jgi:predicted lipoprotein with Yx(FWY)xxD motif
VRNIFAGVTFMGIVGLAACGGGGSSGGGGMNPPSTPPPVVDNTLPQAVSVSGKMIWESHAGLPLYVFSGDAKNKSNCTGACATIWPPLFDGATSKPVGDFTIVTRTNPSGSQWAYIEKPLYTFSSDTAGQPPKGNGVNGFTEALVANGQGGAPTPPPTCHGPYC